MICRKCGKLTPDDREACVYCGANLEEMKRGFAPGAAGKPGVPPLRKDAEPPTPPAGDAARTQISRGETPDKPVTPPEGAGVKPGSPGAGDAGKTQISSGAGKKIPQTPPGDAERTRISDRGGEVKPDVPSAVKGPKPSEEEETLRKALAGRYEIIRKLGTGGMATVYLAREVALDREVAIKLLPRAFTRDANFVARFKNEAQVAANLEHPHIVRIYQISEEKDLVYFVMSYIPSGSLTDRIKEHGTIPIDDIVRWGIDVCSALAYGHEHGVIHRDLKPDNIMLDKNDRVVVMDYGIARAGQGSGLTQTGSVIGTPQYMSPEQARGVELDARSDIYSLGIVLYQMATGELPFQATDAASLMYMHVHETPEPPDARKADIPEWLRDIILKCLAKNPVDRFADAGDIKQALQERYAPKLTITPLAEIARKKRRIMLASIAIAAAVLIAVSGILLRRYSEQKSQAEQARIESERQTQQRQQQELESAAVRDDKAYEQAISMNEKQAYNNYLMLFPEGKHIEEARAMITALDEQEAAQREKEAVELGRRREEDAEASRRRQGAAEAARRREEAEDKARQDDMAYQQALIVNTGQSFSTYMELYPGGRHFDEAMDKLATLDEAEAAKMKAEAEATAKRDNQAFQIASNDDTKQAYNTYLISYPSGRHSDEARSRIAAFDKKGEEAEKVRTALSQLSLRIVKIPGGSFLMGSEDGGSDEKPVKTITLSGFEMGSTEITQAQYNSIMGGNPSFFKLDDNSPVEKVSWKDAITFCNKLSERIGLEPSYNLSTGACDFSKNGFRLPTEAEWEYACRSESGSEYSLGDGESALNRAGWYNRNSMENTHPAGQKTPNVWGLYDIHGNVWEWCNDWYSKNAYETNGTNNPTGPKSGSDKVVRGGSWLDGPKDCRSAKRRNFNPDKDYSDIGLRIVRR